MREPAQPDPNNTTFAAVIGMLTAWQTSTPIFTAVSIVSDNLQGEVWVAGHGETGVLGLYFAFMYGYVFTLPFAVPLGALAGVIANRVEGLRRVRWLVSAGVGTVFGSGAGYVFAVILPQAEIVWQGGLTVPGQLGIPLPDWQQAEIIWKGGLTGTAVGLVTLAVISLWRSGMRRDACKS